MKKNLSLILNVVLLIAVAVLYYFHFTSCNQTCEEGTTKAEDTAAVNVKPVVMSPKDIKASKIVYINTDVLNENYEYVKELSSVAKSRLQSMESSYAKKGKDFQDRYMEFQQKAQAGLLSENQTLEAQQELQKKKDELDQMEMKQQELVEQMQRDNEKVLQTVMEYIKEYNKSSQYNYILAYSNSAMSPVMVTSEDFDITAEIVEGLNAQYNAKKGKK
ncbi:MAG: OmpH family outer membrane protein [Bacteroidota bacterium]|nr:OmpH family outer membrane protein [Bacteroidota bacterium]